jgi:hypothetical protein
VGGGVEAPRILQAFLARVRDAADLDQPEQVRVALQRVELSPHLGERLRVSGHDVVEP